MIYSCVMLFIYLLLINLFSGQVVTSFDKEKFSTLEIIIHNVAIFLRWQISFIFTPLYWLFETLVLSWTLKTGIVTFGLAEAFQKIFRHGIIEIPSIFLYQLLALSLFYHWLKNKSFKTIVEYLKVNKDLYLLSLMLIIISGVVEGISW